MVRRCLVALGAFVMAVGALPVVSAPAQAVEAPVAFTAAALPTYQANGIAWAVASSGGLVFVGGTFSALRPPGSAAGTNQVSRTNFAVLDAATGQPTSCAPTFTNPSAPSSATVRSLNVSPDGRTLYVGGYFSTVNGVAAQHLAAIDIASCSLVSSFKPLPSGTVRAITSTATAVYFGGALTSVAGTSRARAAAVSAVGTSTPGALLAWAPAFDLDVRALARKPDDSAVVVGGDFTKANGADSHALVVVDPAAGSNVATFAAGFVPAASVVKSIAVDATGFYTGNEGTGFQQFDGRIAVNWSGFTQRWRDTCLGATQSVVVYQGVLYAGDHAHDCSTMGEFPDGPRNHFTAESVNDPTLLPWFPNTNEGLGEGIGPRGLVVAHGASSDFMYAVGEFTTVNGVAQQSITRFGQGPDTTAPSSPTSSVTSASAGQVRVAWRESLDTDDATLTYSVYRDGGTTPVYTTTASSFFWARRQLTFTDSGLVAGSTHTYKVSASDGVKTTTTPSKSVVVARSSTSPYAERVLADGASSLWRYDEPSDVFVSDAGAGDNNATLLGGATYQVSPAAIAGDPSKGITLTGSTARVYSETLFPKRTAFSLETWFKTTSTTGGKIIGFGNKQQVDSRYFDKHLYMTTAGKLVFGVNPGTMVTLTSPLAYNDGQWHQVVATQGSGGMTLYVDGARIGRNTTTTNWAFSGYWRVGGDNLTGWPSAPANEFWHGSLDETAVYPTALSATTVAQHYALAGGTALSTRPADFYGKTVYDDDPLFYWRLGEASGATAADTTGGGNPGTYSATGVTYGQPGAVTGTTDTSVALNGATGQVASASMASPATYSTEAWFKTSSTTGGRIIGFGSSATGSSTTSDRHVYLTNAGKLVYGVKTSATALTTITSTGTYNDGRFHHVVATQGSAGMALYVDGALVGSNTTRTTTSYTGYWRVGGDSLSGWPSAPTSAYLSGNVDEAAVYVTALTATQVSAHFSAGRSGGADTAPPTAPALTGSMTSGNGLLSWTGSTDNVGVTGYDVYRSTTDGFTPDASTLIASVTGTSYTDSAVTPGSWYYRVVAGDAAGNRSDPSNTVNIVVSDTVAPSVPAGVAVTTTASSASVSWTSSTDNVGVVGYDVYRSTTSGFTPSSATLVSTVTGTSIVDSPLAAGTYYYRVDARDAAGNVSAASDPAQAVVGSATVVTVNPTADTYANAGATTSNYGTTSSLYARGTPGYVSYLRFALPAAPAGRTLTGAVLRIHTTTDASAGSADAFPVRLAGDSWGETTLTWANRPALASGNPLGTIAAGSVSNSYISVTLDPAGLAALVGGQGTFAITSAGSDSMVVWSRNFSTTSYRPQLTLTYS